MTTPITEIIAVKRCSICAAELLARDKFCRHCGFHIIDGCVTSALTPDASLCETRPLDDDDGHYQSISSALVRIVTQGVSNKAKLYEAGRGRKRLIAALTTLPIWLLIVLLSPMEAYAAAKAITRQL